MSGTPSSSAPRGGAAGAASPWVPAAPAVLPALPPEHVARARPGLARRAATVLRRHWVFCLVLALGVTLRVLAFFAYQPALMFYGDSYSYIRDAREVTLNPWRPWGYSAFLRLIAPTNTLALVPTVQHLIGVGLGITLYAWLRHRSAGTVLALVGSTPILLDAYQIDIEQFIMAETLFEALLVGTVLLLTWPKVPSPVACGLAGLCVAGAALTRTAGLIVGGLVLLYLLVRRVGVLRLAVCAVGVALPLIGYAAWFHHQSGRYALTGGGGIFLYGRIAPFAECSKINPSPAEYVFCSPHPPKERPGTSWYVWNVHSPRRTVKLPFAKVNLVAGSFAKKAIQAQPLDYAKVVSGDLAHYFAPGRWVGPRDFPVGSWRFPTEHPDRGSSIGSALRDFEWKRPPKRYNYGLGAVLRGYQRQGFTPGPFLAVSALIGVVATVGWPGSGRGEGRTRWDCLLLVTTGLSLLIMAAAGSVFEYRYLLPTLIVLPPAAALGLHQIRLARRVHMAADTTARTRPPR